jgi:hypothetical protein
MVASANKNDWMSIRRGRCEEDKNVLSLAGYQTLVIHPYPDTVPSEMFQFLMPNSYLN